MGQLGHPAEHARGFAHLLHLQPKRCKFVDTGRYRRVRRFLHGFRLMDIAREPRRVTSIGILTVT